MHTRLIFLYKNYLSTKIIPNLTLHYRTTGADNDINMIDKIAYLHLFNGKILSTRSKGKDRYYIPGGKREGSETDLETLVREIKEELTVNIIPETAKLYGIFEAQAHSKSDGITVRMTCYTADFKGKPMASSEIAEIAWLSYKDIDSVSPVDKLIFKDLLKKGLLL